ncbi:SPFH domain-containing protein [Clostridium grantii]|uniref:Membrane protease subunit, stomatin/prohibitin family, contains C-terminal Zn-ribbon domain n=1 Tax=Clostridium grantii DSM 8605 TaxID=1121316 RepID=A0A1M5U4C5_9CLOT|nr:SPFH domain-containing protein [Clostridium grantii]SHH57711.1 Membrane protease subunit, stomatin/prohibitin family, contains C-terminal Zn-ribbon domain [Clostridium grantii DSM 8605]
MGLFNFIKSQFIEVIEWTDSSTNTMVYRFPVDGNEIKMGAQLTVRESQTAVFVNEGTIADVFTPGKYTLSTENMPILTKLKSWKYGFDSPFKAEVYFVNTKQFTDQKWGTSNPIMMRDAEFGMLRLRAFGIYSYRVSDATKFLKEIFGTSASYDTSSIEGQLKKTIVSGLSDMFGEAKIPALDLAMYYDELSEQGKKKMIPKFENYGFQITSLLIENISLPEEVEKVMDKRTSMGVLGNLNDYAKYQAAEAMRDAAQNPNGGLAGAGVGLGAGAALGGAMTELFKESNKNEPKIETVSEKIACPHCAAIVDKKAKFCPECGKTMEEPKDKCIKCSADIKKGAKFCAECGAPQVLEKECPNCSYKLSLDSKFCPECGTKVD